MKIFACFPSKYLKAADLRDQHVSAIMSHVALEEVRGDADDAKLLPILYFRGISKGMVINKTKAKIITAAYDEETEAWAGMPIVLFPGMVAYGSEMVAAICVKAPSAAERIRAIKESPHKDALGEHMAEQFQQRPINTAWVPPATTEADMARARQAFATKKPTPRPRVEAIASVMHDADGVVWDDAGERVHTAEETAELSMSLQRSVAALDARKEATPVGDGLDIPGFLQRGTPKPTNGTPMPTNGTGEYHPYSWIDDMQGVA